MKEKTEPILIELDHVESTNRYLQELISTETLPDETVVVTRDQTAGRGQMGNRWESEPGENLTMSLLYRPTALPANRAFVIVQLAALSVKKTLDHYVEGVQVKWPNDIYWREQKLCGILIENQLLGGHIDSSIIGVGLNLNQTRFLSDAPNPISLRQITGERHDPRQLLEEWRHNFHRMRISMEHSGEEVISSAYKEALYRREGLHRYEDAEGSFEAEIAAIEPDGHLLLQRVDGTWSRYAFKEVRFIR